MKNGPPKNDMIIPTGTSYGANSVRDNISQNKVNKLPSNAETGTSSLLSYPAINLDAWGTISPMKPSNPAKLIALPESSDESTINIKRYLDTFKPKDLAVSSPKDKMFIS